MKKYKKDLLNNPFSLFSQRTEDIKLRIMKLEADYKRVDHFVSKAIIEEEMEKVVDDLVERTFVLQGNSSEGEQN